MTGTASTRGLWPLCGLILAAIAACQGSDPQPLELVAVDPFGDQGSLVAGGGASSTVGFTASRESVPIVRFVRHDVASPDLTALVGDVRFAESGSVTRLVVSDEAAVATVGGIVKVVDLSDPTLPVESLDGVGDAADLAVKGRWVLAAVGGELVLVDRDAPVTPARYAAIGAPTALLATQGGFLAFTTIGYVVVDPGAANPFTESSDALLANVEDARADGAGAVVAGPAPSFGRSRLLRLDLTDPASPVIVRTLELEGAYVAFAWDGDSTAVVAIHGAGDDANPRSFHEGYVVREEADGFAAVGVPLTFWSVGDQPLSAHASRLFAAQARGLALLRIR